MNANPGLDHGKEIEITASGGGNRVPAEPFDHGRRSEVAGNCVTGSDESSPGSGSSGVDPGKTLAAKRRPGRPRIHPLPDPNRPKKPWGLDLRGQRFGLLTVIEQAGHSKHRQRLWLCRCDCGKTSTPTTIALRQGLSRSCGCRMNAPTHGGTNSREYRCWAAMRTRCFNEKTPTYRHYGGRGVTIAPQWDDFAVFLRDVGPRPAGTTLDRFPDPKGNYEPGNVRWATPLQQQNNRRNNGRLYLGAVSIGIGELARVLGLGYHDVYRKLMAAWPELQARESA